MYKEILVFIITVITLLYLIKKIKLKESFYTFFLPTLTYTTPDYNPPNVSQILNPNNYDYKPLKIGTAYIPIKGDKDFSFINYFIKQLLKHTPITYIDLKQVEDQNSFTVFKELLENKFQIAYLSSIILYNKINQKNNINNIYFLTNFGYWYVYLLTDQDSNIIELTDLEGKTISCEGGNETQVFNDLKNFYGFKNIKIQQELAAKGIKHLREGKVDALIYTDYFPSLNLRQELGKFENRKLVILPISPKDTELFSSIYPYYEPSLINLNYMNAGYFPKKVGPYIFNKNRPNNITLRCFNTLVCNKKIKSELVKNIMTYFYTNYKKFNHIFEAKQELPISQKLKITDLALAPFYMEHHPEVSKLQNKMGLINLAETETEIEDNRDCIYFLDKMQCNKPNLEKYYSIFPSNNFVNVAQ